MEFDGLRLVLLLIGVGIVAGVYLWSRTRMSDDGAAPQRIEPAIGDAGERSDPPPLARPRVEPVVREPTEAEPVLHDDDRVPTLYDEIFRPPEPGMPSDVIVVNVFAPDGADFGGTELDSALRECGMEYGAMRIYHRMDAAGDRLFSLVNSVEPGYFEPQELETFSTPGVSLFLILPGPQRPAAALEELIATAQSLTRHLEGRLLDSDRNPLRTQGIEHLRERVREFERRLRVAQAGKATR